MNLVSQKLKAINNLARNKTLSAGAKETFLLLISFCNRQHPDRCCPSITLLRYYVDHCEKSFKIWIRELVDSECISRVKEKGKRGSWYVLNFKFMSGVNFTPVKKTRGVNFTLLRGVKNRGLAGYALSSAQYSRDYIESQLKQRRNLNVRCTLYERPSDETVKAFVQHDDFKELIHASAISWDSHMTDKFLNQMHLTNWKDSKGKRIRHWKKYLLTLADKYHVDLSNAR